MSRFLILILPFLLMGCEKRGTVEFVQVVQNHEELTVETLDAVIASIQDDMEDMRAAGTLTPDAESGALDLIDRLIMIKDQGGVISDYVFVNTVDNELLARLLRAQWKD